MAGCGAAWLGARARAHLVCVCVCVCVCASPPPLDHGPSTLDLGPSTLVSRPWTLDPRPSALDPGPSTLGLQPWTLDLGPSTLDPRPSTLDPRPSTLDPRPSAFGPRPTTLDPRPSTLDPRPPFAHFRFSQIRNINTPSPPRFLIPKCVLLFLRGWRSSPSLSSVRVSCTCFVGVGGVSVVDHVSDLVQNAKADNVNVLQSLTSMLRSTVSQFKVNRKLNPLTGLPRSDDVVPRSCSVQRACISSDFDFDVVQMEVEGEENTPTGKFRRKRLNPIVKPAGNWPDHWIDTVHETDGHAIDEPSHDRGVRRVIGHRYEFSVRSSRS